ncbi:MAG: hypothetical protein J6U50_07020 [Lachnospiraceae bacterium]|nr:hypothetical protein [Lachnospiraceae bacterium]
MSRLTGILMAAMLMLNLTACGAQETKLCAGYCSFYSDGGLGYYYEYTYEYDSKGRLTEECLYYNGNLYTTKEIEYDSDGGSTESEYDQRNNLKFVREYDDKGRLMTQSEYGYDDELVNYFEYNREGLITLKESFAWSHYIITYEYDGDGNLVKETETDILDNGSERKYESLYDADGIRIQRTLTTSDGNSVIDFYSEIEEDGNRRIIREYGQHGELRFVTEREYDEEGNMIHEVTTNASDNELLSTYEYEYDSEGRVTGCVMEMMHDRSETRYTYYEDGELSTQTVITYRWISSEAYGDGSDAVLTECARVENYDTDGRLTREDNLVDGNRESYIMYYYEDVQIKTGSKTTFDFREDGRELDPRSSIVY